MNAPHPADDRLIAYVLDESNAFERADVEAHLEACEPCRSTVLALNGAMASVRHADEPEPPARILVDLLQAQADARERRFSRRWYSSPVGMAAAAVLLVGIFAGGFLAGRQTSPMSAPLASAADSLRTVRYPLPEPPEIPFQTALAPASD